jgi:phosphoribosyl 1,2-cyclic phosphate phosphodiesterase
MKAKFIFLGTGGSMGVPVIGCKCHVCKSEDPKNSRLRSSGLIVFDNKKVLIDCGPDFRYQALRHGIDHLDGVFLTHGHYDHTASLDDLRGYFLHDQHSIPILLSKETAADVVVRFNYVFKKELSAHFLMPKIDLQLLPEERGEKEFAGLDVRYFTFDQVGMKVNGLRIGNFAYVSDIKTYPESIFEDLKGVETLVLSALRFPPSHMHLSVDEAVEFAQRVGAKQTWLTHISHDLEHEKTNAYLPSNIRMAYDGLEIPL